MAKHRWRDDPIEDPPTRRRYWVARSTAPDKVSEAEFNGAYWVSDAGERLIDVDAWIPIPVNHTPEPYKGSVESVPGGAESV